MEALNSVNLTLCNRRIGHMVNTREAYTCLVTMAFSFFVNRQEGAAIVAFKLVSGGVFNEEGVSELLLAPGKMGNNSACSGTRNLQDNLSDLRAQACNVLVL